MADIDTPQPIDLVRELRETLGMFAGAMPVSPQTAWEEALGVVRDLCSGRCWKCHERTHNGGDTQ